MMNYSLVGAPLQVLVTTAITVVNTATSHILLTHRDTFMDRIHRTAGHPGGGVKMVVKITTRSRDQDLAHCHDPNMSSAPLQPPSENMNQETDMSSCPPAPSAAHVSSSETGGPAAQFVPGLSHCRGGQSHRRHNQVRGLRRGGRSRPQDRRAAPITEHLDRLRLTSDCSGGLMNTKAPGSRAFCPGGTHVHAEEQELQTLAGEPQKVDATEGHGHRTRRRGPQRPALHAGASGAVHCHWESRASRNRGGGARPGHSRGFQQKMVVREPGREEVL